MNYSHYDEESEEEEEMYRITNKTRPMTITRAIRKNDIEFIRQILSSNQYKDAVKNERHGNDYDDDDEPFYQASILGRTEIMILLLDAEVAGVYSGGGATTPLFGAASRNQVIV